MDVKLEELVIKWLWINTVETVNEALLLLPKLLYLRAFIILH